MTKTARRAILFLVAAWIIGGTFGIWYSAKQIRDSQVAACKDSLNPGGVRYIVADRIRKELSRSKALNIKPEAVAQSFGITVEQAREGIAQNKLDQRGQIRDLLGVNCAAQYPLPWPL